MDISKFIVESIVAVIAGCLGASISAIGGFALFGVLGVVGFIYVVFTGEATLLEAATTTVILIPSTCFLGGIIATAYTRKRGLIQCGKDIGRSLVEFKRFDVIAVGGLGGFCGYLIHYGFNQWIPGKLDTIALTIVVLPLVLKFWWKLTKTNDCEGSSHAVPSPYRFFEKLSSPLRKAMLAIVIGILSAIGTWLLTLCTTTAPFAGFFMFSLSAASLCFVFTGVPMPATHHFSAPAATIVVLWLSKNEGDLAIGGVLVLVLWAVFAALFGMLAGDILDNLLFKEGDIHVDPPAMGITISTVVILTVSPLLNVYTLEFIYQSIICIVLIILFVGIKIRKHMILR